MTRDSDDSTTLEGAGVQHRAEPRKERISLVLYHSDGVSAVELVDGGSLVVGRSSSADVQLDLRVLSRRHAQFERRKAAVDVVDLDSRNGTFVGNQRITRARLVPGAVAMLGDPLCGIAAVVEPLPLTAITSQKLLAYDDFRAELAAAVRSARADGQPVALLMMRAGAQRSKANLSQWAAELLTRLGSYRAAGVCDPQTLLLLLDGEPPERARALAAKLTHALRERDLSCGIACLPGAGATAEELLHAARRACMGAGRAKPVVLAGIDLSFSDAADDQVIIGSPAMGALYQLVHRVAPTDVTVLIHGETGTGKEVIANTLHRLSPRSDAPFRTVNCAAIPASLLESTLFGHEKGAFTGADKTTKGIFEQADGGTVFLDEIGELSAPLQAALLRVLETKRVGRIGSERELQLDVRIIAATHRDLERMAEQQQFRHDLWFRLSAFELTVPPLRDRPEEIAPLIHQFLRLARTRFGSAIEGFEPGAMQCLTAYRWPGNVRELRNVIERAVVLAQGPLVNQDDLSERVRRAAPSRPASSLAIDTNSNYHDMVRDYEIRLLEEGLRIAGGNQTRAAQLLKIPLRTFSYKLRQYAIKSK